MIIDAHTHGFNGRNIDRIAAAGGEWTRQVLATYLERRRDKPQAVNVALRVEMLDRNHIDLQVVTPSVLLDSNCLPGDVAAQLALARAINDNMATIMEDSNGRLLAGATIPLVGFEQGGQQEMERAIKGLGLKVITLPSNLRGKPIDLPEFEPFWAEAESMDIPVYIHPTGPAGQTDRSYEADYDLIHNFGWPFETTLTLSRLVFSGIMERYPTLKVLSHHLGGGMIPFYWGRICETYEPENQKKHYGVEPTILPKPLFDYFSRFYYDTAAGGSAPAIKCTYDVFGADQLVFATDAPAGPNSGEFRLAEYPKVIESLGLPEEDKRKIFEGNARRMLNLS